MAHDNTNMRVIVGIALIIFGGLFLLDNYGVLNFNLPDFLWHWEYILIGIGILLIATSRNKTAGFIVITVGLINLFPNFWPLLLVGLGIYVIYKSSSHKHSPLGEGLDSTKSHNDVIDDISIFGGGTKNFITNNFRGGKLTAIFGGAEIHLEKSILAPGNSFIDLFAMFGGYEITVPKDWKVVVNVVPLFGGCSDERAKDPNRVYNEDKVLYIKGMVIFGGAEIKSY